MIHGKDISRDTHTDLNERMEAVQISMSFPHIEKHTCLHSAEEAIQHTSPLIVRLRLEDIGLYCSRRAEFLYLLAKKFEVATICPFGVTMRLYEPHTMASKNSLLFAQIICPIACCNHNICILFFDVYWALIFRVHVMYLLDDTS